MCVISAWFGDICCSIGDFCTFYKRSRSLLFKILFVAAFYAKTNVTSRAWKAALNRDALSISRRHSARRQRIAPFDLRGASLPVSGASLPVSVAISIMFLDALCSKKWYDMPHTGCGIHSLQGSTISRIGRHSAGYN